MPTIYHPQSGTPIDGVQLGEGAILQEEDMYSSTGGDWRPCPFPGQKHQGAEVIWVRPRAILSEVARQLLVYLNRSGGTSWHCLAKPSFHNLYFIVPSPSFTWDRRINLKWAKDPNSVRELIDFGFLAPDHDRHRWHPTTKEVYVLTEKGKQKADDIVSE